MSFFSDQRQPKKLSKIWHCYNLPQVLIKLQWHCNEFFAVNGRRLIDIVCDNFMTRILFNGFALFKILESYIKNIWRAQTIRNDQVGNKVISYLQCKWFSNFSDRSSIVSIFFNSCNDVLYMLTTSVIDEMSWLQQMPKFVSSYFRLSLS